METADIKTTGEILSNFNENFSQTGRYFNALLSLCKNPLWAHAARTYLKPFSKSGSS